MGSCHSSGLLLSNIFIFLSEFWVQLGQQLVSADIEQATKASKTQVALTSFSFVHRRAPTFGILLQSAMFQIRQQGMKTIKGIRRALASTQACIGPGKRQSLAAGTSHRAARGSRGPRRRRNRISNQRIPKLWGSKISWFRVFFCLVNIREF